MIVWPKSGSHHSSTAFIAAVLQGAASCNNTTEMVILLPSLLNALYHTTWDTRTCNSACFAAQPH